MRRGSGAAWRASGVAAYFGSHSKARFSHGICPDCYAKKVVGCETKN
jgi:hypothetical protein